MLAVVALVLALYFLVDISRRTLIGYRLQRQAVELQEQIAGLESEQERLEELRQYVQSEEYVARLAREELKMVRAGERLYVVVVRPPLEQPASPLPSAPAPPPAAPGHEPQSHFQEWWAVFFDGPPPGSGP